jgi:hypothetical protein
MTFDAENIALSRSRPWLRIGHASGLGGDASPGSLRPIELTKDCGCAVKPVRLPSVGSPRVRPINPRRHENSA